jgi:hypothetical protein
MFGVEAENLEYQERPLERGHRQVLNGQGRAERPNSPNGLLCTEVLLN